MQSLDDDDIRWDCLVVGTLSAICIIGFRFLDWQWKGDDGWKSYVEDQVKEIESAYQKKKTRVHLTNGFFEGKDYMIDFPHMVQVSLQGGQRKVRREIRKK